jgi:hypothetical protein
MVMRESSIIFRDAICRSLDARHRTKPNRPERRSGLFGSVRVCSADGTGAGRTSPNLPGQPPNIAEQARTGTPGTAAPESPATIAAKEGQPVRETAGSWRVKSPAFCAGNRPGNRFGRTSDRPTNGGRTAAETRGKMPRKSSGKRGVKRPGPGAAAQGWEGLGRGVTLTRWTMPVGRRWVRHWMSNFAASAARPSG